MKQANEMVGIKIIQVERQLSNIFWKTLANHDSNWQH